MGSAQSSCDADGDAFQDRNGKRDADKETAEKHDCIETKKPSLIPNRRCAHS